MFHVKEKEIKFGTKTALFEYFLTGIWKLLPTIKNAKLHVKQKTFNPDTKDTWFGYF